MECIGFVATLRALREQGYTFLFGQTSVFGSINRTCHYTGFKRANSYFPPIRCCKITDRRVFEGRVPKQPSTSARHCRPGEITPESTCKYLGHIMDSTLAWKLHTVGCKKYSQVCKSR